MAEELYNKQGQKFGFKDIVRLASYVSAGRMGDFAKEVMPVAEDRIFRVPIYELPNMVIGKPTEPDYKAAYYPYTKAVMLNPHYIDRANPEKTRVQNTLDHEMYHHAANIDRGLVDRANDLIEANPKAASTRNNVNYYLDKNTKYEKYQIPEEVQAFAFSNTLPSEYGQKPKGKMDMFLTPESYYMGGEAAKVMQDAIYPALRGQAKKRFERMAPKQEVPESGYIQNALDSFMSIIGLGK